jgi:polyisoprenoid-binding protein YceI
VTCSAGISPAPDFRRHSELAGCEAKNLSSRRVARNWLSAQAKNYNASFSALSASLRWIVVVLSAVPFLFAAPALRAQETVLRLDPTATKIDFTLAATLHTVHGTFKLKSGEIHFDPATGKVTGSVIVDATSGNTDNASRDKKMHADVLESAQFPEIVFTPAEVEGTILPQGTSEVEVSGVFRIHGKDHSATIAMAIDRSTDGHFHASTKFPVPYVSWGLKDPSSFFLHVGDTVNLDVNAAGQIVPAANR